jgi:uncharacterized iron-regulated membrane protein
MMTNLPCRVSGAIDKGPMNLFRTILKKPSSLVLRRWLVLTHLSIGLTVGLLVSAQGLTGSVIVFREEIIRTANAHLMDVDPLGTALSLERQADEVCKVYPGVKVSFVALPQNPRESTRFVLASGAGKRTKFTTVYTNPYTGEILGANPSNPRWLDWLQNYHKNLLSGREGRIALGIVAILFLTLCVTGILIWWPGRAHWARHFKIKTRLRGWRLALSVHKAIGICAVVFLSMFAATAITFAWNVSKIVYWVTQTKRPAMTRIDTNWKPGDRLLPLDTYVANARQAIPEPEPVFLILPNEQEQSLRIAFRLPNDFRRDGAANLIYLDPLSGAVLRVDRIAESPLGDRVLANFSTLHFGEFGIGLIAGLPIKMVWAVLGLMPAVLFVTGFFTWWKRARERARRIPNHSTDQNVSDTELTEAEVRA